MFMKTAPEYADGRLTIPEYAEKIKKHYEELKAAMEKYEGKWTDGLYEKYYYREPLLHTREMIDNNKWFPVTINGEDIWYPDFKDNNRHHILEIAGEQPIFICNFVSKKGGIWVKGKHRYYHFFVWNKVNLPKDFYKNPTFDILGVDGRTVEIRELVKKAADLVTQKVEDEIRKDDLFQKLLSLGADGVLTWKDLNNIRIYGDYYFRNPLYTTKFDKVLSIAGET